MNDEQPNPDPSPPTAGSSLEGAAPPREFAPLQQRIAARRESLPKRLVQVADFVLAHPQEMAFSRVADVAARAGVQPSTMIRFAQALGYTGFSDLQAVFLTRARERWPDYGERLDALGTGDADGGDASVLLRGFLRASTESILRAADTVVPESLERAVAVLAAARTIALLGSRRAFPAVAYLAYALRRLAVRCELIEQPAGLGPEQIALMTHEDALLAVSFTPYAPVTVQLATSAFRRGVPVVAITDSAFSPLTQAATAWLEVAEADHAGFRSLAGTFAVATTLAVAVAARRGHRGRERME